ncbi:hypothetical protein H257_17758 [Aphanomyces astaci]|uniref:Uncharacterized protein n=1 Tax=Aphanomyces astaci TaxID=112090 RepID=W4FDL4_APHAT|nr:hypothetical protein H257_17758 [Aphanomyces astaci]ETV65562.1 hypothetical protein H257_17758 [Aphanomyces astaci]|eukprot:XP_009844951.1 hypothetical protein H257_17758 [Aphanomyces astaci]
MSSSRRSQLSSLATYVGPHFTDVGHANAHCGTRHVVSNFWADTRRCLNCSTSCHARSSSVRKSRWQNVINVGRPWFDRKYCSSSFMRLAALDVVVTTDVMAWEDDAR